MGTEAIWVPLVTAAVAGGAQMYNTNKTARRQDSEMARQIAARGERQRGADQRVSQLLQDMSGQSADRYADSARGNFLQQIQRANQMGGSNLGAMTGASERYARDAADAALGVADYANTNADLAARTMAPGMRRESQELMSSDAARRLALLARESGGQDFLGQLKMQGIRRNPYIDAASAALQGYSAAYGGGGR